MLCDKCQKNEATIHIKDMHNGQTNEWNLCAECAAKMEDNNPIGLNLTEMLFNLGKISQKLKDEQSEDTSGDDESTLVCSNCGWTPEKIREYGGLLGCAECYQVFAPMLEEAIKSVHRGSIHMGKHPGLSGAGPNRVDALKREMEQVSHQLEEFVRTEAYENAAGCRDRINLLKAQIKELENK